MNMKKTVLLVPGGFVHWHPFHFAGAGRVVAVEDEVEVEFEVGVGVGVGGVEEVVEEGAGLGHIGSREYRWY